MVAITLISIAYGESTYNSANHRPTFLSYPISLQKCPDSEVSCSLILYVSLAVLIARDLIRIQGQVSCFQLEKDTVLILQFPDVDESFSLHLSLQFALSELQIFSYSLESSCYGKTTKYAIVAQPIAFLAYHSLKQTVKRLLGASFVLSLIATFVLMIVTLTRFWGMYTALFIYVLCSLDNHPLHKDGLHYNAFVGMCVAEVTTPILAGVWACPVRGTC